MIMTRYAQNKIIMSPCLLNYRHLSRSDSGQVHSAQVHSVFNRLFAGQTNGLLQEIPRPPASSFLSQTLEHGSSQGVPRLALRIVPR